MRNWNKVLWVALLTILGIACFPMNPLVLTGLLEPGFYLPLFILGWVVWAAGMVLVMAPIVMFPRKGGVPKSKSFVNTTRLVDTGIYAIVRHPQYTGGIYAIFIATLLLYPHWLFAVLGLLGTILIFLSTKEEDKRLIKKFGDEYINYMERVPGMNLISGIIRRWVRRKHRYSFAKYTQRGAIMEQQLSAGNNDEWFQVQKDKIRKLLLKYTRKAFRMLPQMDKPRILDIGCGSGIPTLELVRLSHGEVMGIDIDQPALDKFTRKIGEAGLTAQVHAANCSMFDMDFADESFDIIWSEGSIYAIGFERGLQEWRHFLKPDGFMVVHDEKGNVEEKLEQVSSCGYELLGYFILSEETWWTEYFAPLEKLIAKTRTRYADDPKILEELHQAQGELDMFKKNPERNSSVCFVMKRKYRYE